VVTEDLNSETRYNDSALRDRNITSGMSVIVPVGGRPWGVLAANTVQKRSFTSDDVNFLLAVANILAAAIERKQSEEALQRTEQALRQSDARFRQAQRSASIGAYDWNLQTGKVYWSEELPVLRGLAPDFASPSWLQHVHPDDRTRVISTLKRAAEEGTEFDLEIRMVRDDGSLVWVVNRGQTLFENGHPTHVTGVIMDVTARQLAVERMQRSEKLAMIGRLAASIAHEINNPLESVTNLLYLIEHHPHLDPEIHKYARVAGSELARVAHISRQTLGFYRESAQPVPVRLPELLDDIIRLYSRKLERKRVRVVREYELDGEVCLYPAEIRQVFSNLLMNAFEAVAEEGVITIRARRSSPWSGRPMAGVRITVCDNGHGIEAQHRRRIFEPFFTTKGEKGTGLGLWVTSGLVQKHGGSIRLRTSTQPDRHGTVFSAFLPVAELDTSATTQRKVA
jgi:PAS domain S-box-containing protein